MQLDCICRKYIDTLVHINRNRTNTRRRYLISGQCKCNASANVIEDNDMRHIFTEIRDR